MIVGLGALAASSALPALPLPPRLVLFGFAAVEVVVLLVIPLLVARFALGLEARSVGLTLGDPRRWLPEVGILAIVALPFLVALSRVPSIRAYYPVYSYARAEPWLLVPSTLAFAVYGFAWEFLFRGFLQLGTRPALGPLSLVVQWVPFIVAHAGKPRMEVAATVVSGGVLGALAHRHGTIVPAWLLHLGCSTAVNVLCLLS